MPDACMDYLPTLVEKRPTFSGKCRWILPTWILHGASGIHYLVQDFNLSTMFRIAFGPLPSELATILPNLLPLQHGLACGPKVVRSGCPWWWFQPLKHMLVKLHYNFQSSGPKIKNTCFKSPHTHAHPNVFLGWFFWSCWSQLHHLNLDQPAQDSIFTTRSTRMTLSLTKKNDSFSTIAPW